MDPVTLATTTQQLREHVRSNRQELFHTAPQVIAAAAALICDPNHPIHQQFLHAGSIAGFSAAMVGEALRNALQPLSAEALRLHRDLSTPSDGQFRSPELTFHVLAGNLFISGIESIYTAMLSGAASLVRCSAADTVFPTLWRDAVTSVSHSWANAIYVSHWSSTDEQLTSQACAAADVVIAFGSDESVAAVRALTPARIAFVSHGTKVSFALVSAASLRQDCKGIAARLAYDFSVYDQQGCLSPRAAFLEFPGSETLTAFRNAFVEEMRNLARRLPPGPKDISESAALARERDEALIESVLSDETHLWSDLHDPFVMAVRSCANYRLGSMNRFVDLRLFTRFDEVKTALAPFTGVTATLGISGELSDFSAVAEQLRADRSCPVGEMQKPPLGWGHDGRQPLADLLQFTRIETRGTLS